MAMSRYLIFGVVALGVAGLFGPAVSTARAAGAETPRVCGGSEHSACPAGRFCQMPPGRCGEDGMGVCTVRPDYCIQMYRPVCGCDARTYANDCDAQRAGVNLAHEGPCRESAP